MHLIFTNRLLSCRFIFELTRLWVCDFSSSWHWMVNVTISSPYSKQVGLILSHYERYLVHSRSKRDKYAKLLAIRVDLIHSHSVPKLPHFGSQSKIQQWWVSLTLYPINPFLTEHTNCSVMLTIPPPGLMSLKLGTSISEWQSPDPMDKGRIV